MDDDRIFGRLQSERCFARAISVDHLGDLRKDLEDLYAGGLIDEELLRTRLSHFSFGLPKEMPGAKFVVVAAVPQPVYTITFHRRGKRFPVVLPPTYADGDEITEKVRKLLIREVGDWSFISCAGSLPVKTLAVRSGLAQYGRNNITYIGTLGSFHRLSAYYTNYTFDKDHWQERQALRTCSKCTACIGACPTKAITEDRFIIRAERCLCYLNEKPAGHPFPDWVSPEWHNAIAGCMHCQNVCPHNSSVVAWNEERESFDEDDRAYLLAGEFQGERAERMERRLGRLGLELSMFPRNLEVLLDRNV